MRIILHETAHPHQAMQRAAGLVAMAGAEFGHPQRQIPVAVQAAVVDLHMARAVHRLDRVDPLVFVAGREHVLAELVPVTGLAPTGCDPRSAGYSLPGSRWRSACAAM